MSTAARHFLDLLRQEQRKGIVTIETEQHFKHDFRKLGNGADDAALAASVWQQIERLEREAEVLRKFRARCFGVG